VHISSKDGEGKAWEVRGRGSISYDGRNVIASTARNSTEATGVLVGEKIKSPRGGVSGLSRAVRQLETEGEMIRGEVQKR
jgi:hypothetical protein